MSLLVLLDLVVPFYPASDPFVHFLVGPNFILVDLLLKASVKIAFYNLPGRMVISLILSGSLLLGFGPLFFSLVVALALLASLPWLALSGAASGLRCSWCHVGCPIIYKGLILILL